MDVELLHRMKCRMNCRQTWSSSSWWRMPWTELHRLTYIDNSSTSITTFCLNLPAPAHEYETLWTVIIRCNLISQHRGQPWTIIIFDEALCSNATELLWDKPEESNAIILRLGGIHSSMAYLAAVGKHFSGSGVEDCWMESGIYSQKTLHTTG